MAELVVNSYKQSTLTDYIMNKIKPNDKEHYIYENPKTKDLIYVVRPSKPTRKTKHEYDINKNFQIFLKMKNEPAFKPNHGRILIDLILRTQTILETEIDKLYYAFEEIYEGSDPITILKKLDKINFKFYLNDLYTIGILTQLHLIEQHEVYPSERSKWPDKPETFLQGWIRSCILDKKLPQEKQKHIDRMIYSAANGQPPAVKFTTDEHKKLLPSKIGI